MVPEGATGGVTVVTDHKPTPSLLCSCPADKYVGNSSFLALIFSGSIVRAVVMLLILSVAVLLCMLLLQKNLAVIIRKCLAVSLCLHSFCNAYVMDMQVIHIFQMSTTPVHTPLWGVLKE